MATVTKKDKLFNISQGIVTVSAVYAPVSLYIIITSGNQELNTLDLILSIVIGFAVMCVPTFI